MTDAATEEAADDGYGGIIGAFPYAFRASGSRLFRAYVVVGGLIAALVAALVVLALPRWVAATTDAPASVTLSRAFLLLVGLAVFAPLVTPVLLVARRHRREGVGGTYDVALGASGFGFVAAGYLGLVLATPDVLLTGTARAAGAVPPLLAVVVLYLAHRRFR